MMPSSLLRSFALVVGLCQLTSASYNLVQHYHPGNFFDNFNFYTGPDPTNGFVDYVDRATAQANKYIGTFPKHIKLGVDHTNYYSVGGAGRPSVRLESIFTFTHGLVILSLNHMPYACGAWPAFWTLGPAWPTNGEIDIIEGVNRNEYNIVTLHTGPDCTIAGTRNTGTLLTNNCTSSPTVNNGCGIEDPRPQSYGHGFNKAGGGYYVMEWTARGIRTWFFGNDNVPASILQGKPVVRHFGRPMAHFAGSCDFATSFADHQLIFDTTFCGDYAGNTYSYSGCPNAAGGYAACEQFVAGTPHAFEDTYWSINYLKIFQKPRQQAGAKVLVESDTRPTSASSIRSTQPVAATSPIVSQSLKYAGMGRPAAATATDQGNPRMPHATDT